MNILMLHCFDQFGVDKKNLLVDKMALYKLESETESKTKNPTWIKHNSESNGAKHPMNE
jgi:hypothetical protein